MSETVNGPVAQGDIIVLEDVVKEFFVKGRSVPIRALQGASMRISKGDMIAIKGPSGSGKTTLLQMLGALDVPTSGTVKVAGKDLSNMKERELTAHRARTIGFVFQTFNLIPNLSALENVELPMEALGVGKSERRRRAFDLLKSVGMEDRIDHKPQKLSGGEQQRVAIARALSNRPEIILADEPTGSLDSKTGESIMRLLDRLRHDTGATVIVVTHSSGAAKICDFAFTIKDGIITSMANVAQESKLADTKRTLKVDLAISGKLVAKLFQAGYTDIEDISLASVDEIGNALGNTNRAAKIIGKAKKLVELRGDTVGDDDDEE